MAFFDKITKKIDTYKDNIEKSVEGTVEQAQNLAQAEVNHLKNMAADAKAQAESKIKQAKNTVDSTITKVQGMIPGTSNGYVSRVAQEKQKSYNAADDLYSNVNLNDLVLPYENPLLSYHNYTWNFTLYTMRPAEYNAFFEDNNLNVDKYVIAKSGTTGKYCINSVTMDKAGPATPGQTSNFSMNKGTIEIVEQGGQHLFDDLVVLSNELGYKQFMDLPLVLELDFIGYDQDTGEAKIIPGLNRKWGIQINTITGSASKAGGSITYTVTMTSNMGGIVENSKWVIMETYSCNTSTFGSFIQQLQDHLNAVATKQYGYLRFKYDQFANDEYFVIQCPTELANMTINYDLKQSPEVNLAANKGDAAKQFTWNASVPVSRVIDDVLDCCTPLHESTDKKRNFVNVIPVAKQIGNDPIRNVIAYKQYFYVLKYKIGDVTSKDDLEYEAFNLQYFYDNADKIVDEADPDKKPKINAKRYDYQFSGLNNEIIDLDIKFDQQFNIAVTRNPQALIDTSNKKGTHVAETLELAGQEYSTTDVLGIWNKSQELIQSEKDGSVLNDEQKQFIRDAQGIAASKLMPTEYETDQTNLSTVGTGNVDYIEDFRKTIDLSSEGTNGIGIPRVDSIPTENVTTGLTNSGTETDNSSDDEIQRRLIRDNYYNRSFLAKLDMKVVGDPFWLGWGDYSYLNYVKRAVQGEDINPQLEDIHFANYLSTETYLLLNLKPITGINDNTGLLETQESSVFNQTFYRVNTVRSSFNSNGSFTQQISGGLVIRSLRRKEQYTDITEDSNTIKNNGKTK